MSAAWLSPRLLASTDRLDGFECRSEKQMIWLNRHAPQAHARGGTRKVFADAEADGNDVVATYELC